MIPTTPITSIRTPIFDSALPNSLLCTLEDTTEDTDHLSTTRPHIKTSTPCLGKHISTNSSTWEMYSSFYLGYLSFESWGRRCHVLLHPWSRPFRPLLRNSGKISQTFRFCLRLRYERPRFQQKISR